MLVISRVGTAQKLALDEVLLNLTQYLTSYQQKLSMVLADERYEQSYTEAQPGQRTQRLPIKRVLTSDFLFLVLPDKESWLGVRDTLTVDGKPAGDRTSRLERLWTENPSITHATRVTADSARYNLGEVPRTVNMPTQTLDLLHSRYHSRFVFDKDGEETLEHRQVWRIRFREVSRPSVIRTREGADQLARGTVWVNLSDGSIVKTVLDLGDDWVSDFVQTKITVDYHHDPKLGMLVPTDMFENYYRPGDGNRGALHITAHAMYANFRQFQTAIRIVPQQ